MPGLYIGKEVDPATSALGARVDLESSDLLTHGLVVGMTGSGKTGLAVVMIEEALRQGIPVLAIDPKGDLGNLLLLFETLDKELRGMRAEYEKLIADPAHVESILRAGATKARALSVPFLAEIRRRVGVRALG